VDHLIELRRELHAHPEPAHAVAEIAVGAGEECRFRDESGREAHCVAAAQRSARPLSAIAEPDASADTSACQTAAPATENPSSDTTRNAVTPLSEIGRASATTTIVHETGE